MRVAIIGAGLMGHGLAQVMASAGQDVVVHDPDNATLASVHERIAANLRSLGADPGTAAQVELAEELEDALAGAAFVIEAAPEDLGLKRDLFARLDALAPEDAVLASNSSVMRVGDYVVKAKNRGRILGTHWWNPPYLVPLVEVVQGADTAPAAVERTISFLEQLGKRPVHVKRDVTGFVGNRLQHALWREAFDLIDKGVCDPETVDIVVKEGFGRRLGVLGPMENADLVGLDLTLAIHDRVLPELDPPSEPSPGLRERVAQGQLGMRTGSGFREWTDDEAAAVRERMLRALAGVPA